VRKRKGRVLQPDEIRALLDSATSDRYRMLIATAIFTGLRLMELLALRWQDVGDSEIYVRHQLSRMGKRLVDVKTDSGERDVALRPELAAMLKRHKMASRFKQPHDFVFASETGGPLGWRNVERRAMDAAHAAAVKAKRIPATRPKTVLHDCRHTFGAMLIAEGRDVHTVKTMMGHRKVITTIDVYGGDFDKARNADPNAPRPNYETCWKPLPPTAGCG
jgi:integrase